MSQDQELRSLVVIIDDERGLRNAVSGLLEMENIECQGFADGDSAKAWLADNHQSVSVCLLDSSLGASSVSGFELLKYIRDIDVDLPVLFYSGRDENHAKASLEAGATLYVRKPFDPHSLIVMVKTLDRVSKLSKQMVVTWSDRDTLQRCIDAMGAEVMLLDHDNKVLLLNKRKAETISQPIEQVLGSNCWKFACPHDGPCLGCQMIKDDRPNYRATYVNEIEIGSRNLVTQTSPVTDSNGVIRYFVQTATDFTRYKKAIGLINSLTRMSVDRDVQEISNFVVDSLRIELGYSRVRMYVQQKDGLRGIASSGMPDGFDISKWVLCENDKHAQLAFSAKCPVRLTAVELERDDIHFESFEKKGLRYQIQVPAISANSHVALLTVDDKGSSEDLMPEDATLLALIGPAVADAVQSSRLREDQKKRLKWYRGFEEIDNAIVDTRDINETLTTTIDHLVQLLNGSCGVVMRVNENNKGLKIVATSKEIAGKLFGYEHDGNHGLLKRCRTERTQIYVKDVFDNPDFIECFNNLGKDDEWRKTLQNTRTLLLEPVFIRNEVDAIMVVCFSNETQVDCLDLQFVDDMARRVAITLARLDEEKRIEAALLNEVRLKDLALLSTNIAHGVRGPLTALQARFDVALSTINSQVHENLGLKNIVTSAFEEIQIDVQRSISIVNRILDWAGPKGIEPRVIVASDLVGELIEIIKPLYKEKIDLRFFSSVENAKIFIAPDSFRTAITDLFWNAMKVMPDGGRIDVKVMVDDHTVSISVSDTGTGMTPEQQRRVMTLDPFSHPGEETGLGLYLARKSIESFRGKFELTSQLGQGSTFTIVFPRSFENTPT